MAKQISEKDKDNLGLVLDRFARAEAFSKSWHDNGEDYYRRYRFYSDSGKYPYKHNVKDRLTFPMIEVMAARMMQTMFAVDPFFSIVPQEKSDVVVAKQLEKVIQNLIFARLNTYLMPA